MFLGIDLGTTNIKALVVAADGRVVAEGSVPVHRFHTPDGGTEQDLEAVWTATCQAIHQAIDQQDPPSIQAVGISSQGGALQLLDADERPRGRVISWLDGRGRSFDRQLTEELGEDYLAARLGRCRSVLTPGQILRLRAQQPEVLEGANIAFVGDVIVGRLCGRRAHDATSLSIAMLYNPSLGKADPEILARLELTETQLPDLLPVATPAGGLRPEAATQTGLPAELPVSVAVHDQYAAALGTGSVGEGDICLGTGTAWVLVANAGHLAPPVTPETFVCGHPVPGLFGQMLSMGNGGSSLQWALDLVGMEAGALDDAVEAVAPGCNGLAFWPLLSPGVGAAPFARPGGRLSGIGFAHGRGHVLRAVVEGLVFELARHLRQLTEAGMAVDRLAVSGPAAASRVTPPILANAIGCPVVCLREASLSALGAAVVARGLVESKTPLAKLSRQWAPTSRAVEPDENAPVYRELLAAYLEPFNTASRRDRA